ncbi:MAG: hypothetical protein PWP27_2496 [Clostridiales bacterium]|jgi:hypothetical protein|nr:hypothetical protein [Clostridiales bacterium]MDK2934686.1 hypothetical protein [Clostridiales bacterium]
MYRRYYQNYGRLGEEPQRPIGEDTMDTDTENKQHSMEESMENNTHPATKPEIIVPEKPSKNEESSSTNTKQIAYRKVSPRPIKSRGLPGIFGRFGIDDLLLLALIFLVLQEEVNDELLLILLIFLFFIGL